MISPDGALLERRFYCPRDGKEVAADEIVRGYELDDGSYIIVSDKELEAVEPQKTREIELREFVDLAEVAPAFMERGYYLTPGKGATKAYRLLADVMEKTSEPASRPSSCVTANTWWRSSPRTVSSAQRRSDSTTRFAIPQTIGLPEPVTPRASASRPSSVPSAPSSPRRLSHDKLADPDTQKLKAIIARKKKAGKDLIRMSKRPRMSIQKRKATSTCWIPSGGACVMSERHISREAARPSRRETAGTATARIIVQGNNRKTFTP